MEELDLKNKIFVFLLGIIFLYIFLLLPLEKTLKIKKDIENYNKKVYVSEKKIESIEIKLNEKLEELKKIEIQLLDLKKGTYNFSSINAGNIYISNFLEKNFLEIIEIGRIEIIDENSCYIPYQLRGKEENIIKFIQDLEDENKVLLLTKNFEIKKVNEEYELSLYFYFFVKSEKNQLNEGKRKNLSNKFLEIKNIEFINDNTGICEFKDKKFYIKNKKIIEEDGVNYEIILKDKKIFIKDGENEK